jgi:hypothetical protein
MKTKSAVALLATIAIFGTAAAPASAASAYAADRPFLGVIDSSR